MIIEQIQVSNFRSFDNCTVDLGGIQAIVGRNNVGKSNLLKAINLFMEASKRLLSEDCFHHHNTDDPIRIRLCFTDLNEWEKQQFQGWLYGDDTLIVERVFKKTGEDDYDISRAAIVKEPEPEWLKKSEINGDNIDEWWPNQDDLTVNGLDFGGQLGTSKPLVGEWEDAAEEFVEEHREALPFEEKRRHNPKGYKGVLKGALPEFILVPAVREMSEASKITKSSPFGQLIHSVLSRIEEDRKDDVRDRIGEVEGLLNRGEDRLEAIEDFESDLNDAIKDINQVDVEIAMEVPELDDLLETAELYAHDGTRTPVEDKGHGLQRSMIFTILRAYSDLATEQGEETASKSRIFAFEEPEIYQHPQSQRTLLSVFREIADSGDQILYTTHSSHFVNVSRFDEVCIMRKDGADENFCTEPTQLGVDQMLEDLEARKGVEGTPEGMRNQYANAFDTGISEGFFADKVVIVEGQSEKYILPIYARLLDYDFDRQNVAVVYGGGKGQLDRLLRIFAGFDIPTYLIFDGDKNNDDNQITDKTLELLRLMNQEVQKVTQLEDQIEDTFAVWGSKLETVLQQEIDQYDALAQEVRDHWGPVGKPLRHRFMAVQIEKKVSKGEAQPEDLVPPSIREVIEKIRVLDTPVEILEQTTPEAAPTVPTN